MMMGKPRVAGDKILLSGSAALETPAQRALDRVMRSGHPTSVLRLYLSHLQPTGAKPHHRLVARALFDDSVRQSGGQVFTCGNGDLVLIAGPDPVATLGGVLLKLFRPEAPGEQQLLGIWSLPKDALVVRAEFTSLPEEAGPVEDPPVPLGAIAAISASLASAPHGELVRRQTAVRIDGRRVTQLFQELSISVPALEARIGMRVPASADPYLFRYLSGQLDQGMLEPLARADLSEIAALNINLPLASASSLGFAALQFAAKRAGMRLGIELAFVEVVADMRRFTAIRDRLQAEGCRVVLDGIDHHTLLHCDPAALQPDLVKLEWSALMPTQPARDGRRLRAALERIGIDRIVLCRAETEAAMVWGMAHGISRFQGRHVDAMLAAERISTCQYSSGCSLRQCIGRAAATDAAGQDGCHDTALLGGLPRHHRHHSPHSVT
jgi:hypothetical protein